jgi:spore maturation protein CgeB
LFEEDRDVAYFGSDEELVDKVRFYLGHEEERVRMARAAYERVVAGCHTYTDRMRAILKLAAEFL